MTQDPTLSVMSFDSMGTPPNEPHEPDEGDEPSMLDLEAPKKKERKLTLHEQLQEAHKNKMSTNRKFQLMFDYFNANKYVRTEAESAENEEKNVVEKPKQSRLILLNCMDSRMKRASDPLLKAKEAAYRNKVSYKSNGLL